MSDDNVPKISRAEAARRLGVHYNTVKRLAEDLIIRSYPAVGGRLHKVSEEDVDELVAKANTPENKPTK